MKIRPHIRRITGLNACTNCGEAAPEITIEDFPESDQQQHLCRNCAALALAEHPALLAAAVVEIILQSGKGIRVEQPLKER